MNSSASSNNQSQLLSLLDIGNTFLINGNYTAAILAYSNVIQALEDVTRSSSTCTESDKKTKTQKKLIQFRAYSHRSEANIQIHCEAGALLDAEAALAIYDNLAEIDSSNSNSLRCLLLDSEIEMCHSRKERAMTKVESTSNKVAGAAPVATNTSLASKLPTTTSTSSSYTTTATKHTTSVPAAKKQPTCPKYQYYQNDSFMTISILEKNVQPEHLKVDFSLDKLTVVLEKGDVSFTVICGTLFDAVNVPKCKVKYTDEKVLIKLKKLEKHEWHELFGLGAKKAEPGDDKQDNQPPEMIKPKEAQVPNTQSPIRPYASHKDWDAIERDLKNEEQNEKPEGDEALNGLFKSIYGNADENTRRAMVKSFQTSGGTVLSTNWDDVSKTDYEKTKEAPKGQEFKKWEH